MAIDSDILIQFKDAVIANGETPVIHGLNMTVKRGDFVYLTGKVGSGKTSIIRTIIGENALFGGSAVVCGRDMQTLKNSGIAALRRSIGVVFQDFQLLMDRNVYDNLEFVLGCTGWKDKVKIQERIKSVLSDVGMATKIHKMPYQLSGGEQQRIAIARALLNAPGLILADEPTGNLDAETADEIMQLLCNINRNTGTAIVMVTHNVKIVEKYPGRVFECKGEKCVELGCGETGCVSDCGETGCEPGCGETGCELGCGETGCEPGCGETGCEPGCGETGCEPGCGDENGVELGGDDKE